jgi:gliding motility-associated-like protein
MSNNNLTQGSYTLRVLDAKGCSTTTAVAISAPEPIDIQLEVKKLVCAGNADAEIRALATGGTPGYTYAWSNNDSGEKVTNLAPGTYRLTLTDKNGCTSTLSQAIMEPNPLDLNFVTESPDCHGESTGRIQVLANGGKKPYKYSLNNGGFVSSNTFLVLPAGLYILAVKDANACVTDSSIQLSEPLPIAVTLWAATEKIIYGDSVLLLPNVANPVGNAQYVWSSSLLEDLNCVNPECSSILVKPDLSTIFTVTVTDDMGCTGEGEIKIEVEKPRGVYVPTGFSPNGDGNNDILHVHGKEEQIKNIKTFRIFDRWGELVYEDSNFKANDLNRGWDGRFRAKECTSGVFAWLIELEYIDGFIDTAKGEVTLIR